MKTKKQLKKQKITWKKNTTLKKKYKLQQTKKTNKNRKNNKITGGYKRHNINKVKNAGIAFGALALFKLLSKDILYDGITNAKKNIYVEDMQKQNNINEVLNCKNTNNTRNIEYYKNLDENQLRNNVRDINDAFACYIKKKEEEQKEKQERERDEERKMEEQAIKNGETIHYQLFNKNNWKTSELDDMKKYITKDNYAELVFIPYIMEQKNKTNSI